MFSLKGMENTLSGFTVGYAQAKSHKAYEAAKKQSMLDTLLSLPPQFQIPINSNVICEYCKTSYTIIMTNCKNCGAPLLRKI